MAAPAQISPPSFIGRDRTGGSQATVFADGPRQARTLTSPLTFKLEGDIPNWVVPTITSLAKLRSLPPNWNGYGATAIGEDTIQTAVFALLTVMRPSSPAPSVVPLSGGGLQVEWHRRGLHLEIEVMPNERPTFDCYNDQGGIAEGTLPDDRERLREIIGTLA